eukprot:jgi/Tetstr1/460924/TSEL_006077.t2
MEPPGDSRQLRPLKEEVRRSYPATVVPRSPSPYKGWPTGFVGREENAPGGLFQSRHAAKPAWTDTGRLYNETQCPPLPLPADARSGAPAPTFVLQAPYFDAPSLSPSPVGTLGATRSMRTLGRTGRKSSSPLPGGYIACSSPGPALTRSLGRVVSPVSPLGLAACNSSSSLGSTSSALLQDDTDYQDDSNIDAFVNGFKKQRYGIPQAVALIERAWKRHLYTKQLRDYGRMRRVLRKRMLTKAFGQWRDYTRAQRFASTGLMKTVFSAWREYCSDLEEFFKKASLRLEAGNLLSQVSAVQIWRLGASDVMDNWSSRGTITAALISCANRNVPMKWAKAVLAAWRRSVEESLAITNSAAQILKNIMAQMHRERAHWLFRFWHRFTVTKKSERAGVDPPVHRPHLIEWDEWLWQHRRRKQLMRQAKLTHRHFRLRFCFYWLRWHAARNIKMREAWKFAARTKIRAMKLHALKVFAVNAKEERATRFLLARIMKRWAKLTVVHVHLRRLSRQLIEISHNMLKRRTLILLRKYVKGMKVLRAALELRLWQDRSLGSQAVLCWQGSWVQMAFIQAWRAWKNYAIRRISYVTFVGHHMVTGIFQLVHGVFYCWKSMTKQEKRAQRVVHPLAIKPLPPPWRRPLTHGEVLSMVPVNMRTPQRQLASRMRSVVRVEYSRTPHTVIPNRVFRPVTKALQEIWMLRGTVMEKYQASSRKHTVGIWQRVVSLRIDLASKATPDWREVAWELSGRAAMSDVGMSPMDNPLGWSPEALGDPQGGAAADHYSSSDDEDYTLSNDENAAKPLTSIKLTQQERLQQSARSFKMSKFWRRRESNPEGPGAEIKYKQEKQRDVMRGISFKARSLASHSIVLRMARDASGSVDEIEMDEQRQQLRAAYAYDLMLDTEVEYYHKMLAKAEELLEGKTVLILSVGAESLQPLQISLQQMYPWSDYVGESYYWFMRNLILHDEQCIGIDMHKAAARDRVLTSWVMLHQMAVKLSEHRPEFTLQDPSLDVFTNWDAAWAYQNSSESEAGGVETIEEEEEEEEVEEEEPSEAESKGILEASGEDLPTEVWAHAANRLGCSVPLAQAVARMAAFWRRRAALRAELTRLQILLQHSLEQKLMEQLKELQTGENAAVDAEASETVAVEPDSSSSDREEDTRRAAAAVLGVLTSGGGPATQDGSKDRNAVVGSMFGVGGKLERNLSASVGSDDDSSSQGTAVDGVAAASQGEGGDQGGLSKSKRKRRKKKTDLLDEDLAWASQYDGTVGHLEGMLDEMGVENRFTTRKARNKQVSPQQRQSSRDEWYASRRFKRTGVRSSTPSVYSVEPREGTESEAAENSMYWQPTREELEYIALTTPSLPELLQAAGAEERQRHVKAAEELVDRFMAAVAAGNWASAAPATGTGSGTGDKREMGALSKLGEETKDLWVPRMDDLHDVVGAGVDPEALTGFDLHRYSEGMVDMMSRLVVQPLASRLVFWDRVQRANELQQVLREDAALEAQLRQMCYGMAFVTKAHGDYAPRREARFAPGKLRKPPGGLPPMLLAPRPGDARDSGVSSHWGATSVKAGDLRRPVSCEPPLMGIPGIRDPPAARERRYARITSKRQLDVGMGEEGEEEADPFASRQNRSTGDLGAAAQLEQTWLQEVVEARLAYKDDRLDGLVIQELEAVDKESDLLAAATMAVYQAYLPSRGRAAHRGRELKGWTSPRAWEPPCGRYEPGEGPSARQCDEERRAAAEAEAGTWLRQPPLQTWDTGMQEDYNGLRPFGSRPATRESAPTEGPLPPASPLPQVLAMPGAPRPRGTMHDSVRTMPAPAAERPERVSLPNYHRYGLAPVLEARREAEAAREATYQEGLARARERIEERMAERERVREAINRREREKQVEMLSSRRRAEQRRREHQLVILRRRQAAWEERQRQLQKGVVVEYEGFRKEPRPRRVRKKTEESAAGGSDITTLANVARALGHLTTVRSLGRHYSKLQEEYFAAIQDAHGIMDLDHLDFPDDFPDLESGEDSFDPEGDGEGLLYSPNPAALDILSKAMPPISYRPLSASNSEDEYLSDEDVLAAMDREATAVEAQAAAEAQLSEATHELAEAVANSGGEGSAPTPDHGDADDALDAHAAAPSSQAVGVGDPEMSGWLPQI